MRFVFLKEKKLLLHFESPHFPVLSFTLITVVGLLSSLLIHITRVTLYKPPILSSSFKDAASQPCQSLRANECLKEYNADCLFLQWKSRTVAGGPFASSLNIWVLLASFLSLSRLPLRTCFCIICEHRCVKHSTLQLQLQLVGFTSGNGKRCVNTITFEHKGFQHASPLFFKGKWILN